MKWFDYSHYCPIDFSGVFHGRHHWELSTLHDGEHWFSVIYGLYSVLSKIGVARSNEVASNTAVCVAVSDSALW